MRERVLSLRLSLALRSRVRDSPLPPPLCGALQQQGSQPSLSPRIQRWGGRQRDHCMAGLRYPVTATRGVIRPHALLTDWSRTGHDLVMDWSRTGHGLVTYWSWPGHGNARRGAVCQQTLSPRSRAAAQRRRGGGRKGGGRGGGRPARPATGASLSSRTGHGLVTYWSRTGPATGASRDPPQARACHAASSRPTPFQNDLTLAGRH